MTVLFIWGTSRIMTCCYHLLGQFFSTKERIPEETAVLSSGDNDRSQIWGMCVTYVNIFHSYSDPRR